jgi:molybdopterin/thiamine biosynthesis adenylyltransferase
MLAKRKKDPIVFYPNELETNNYFGNLYGYYHNDSFVYNIVNPPLNADHKVIGKLIQSSEDYDGTEKNEIVCTRTDNGLVFKTLDGNLCTKESYSLVLDIFSRHTGILDTDLMINKKVIISGCGSVGSLIALELARSGVGNFLLVDNDILKYHNISRHQCGIKDIGMYKVNALFEKILNINPLAKVIIKQSILEQVPKEVFSEFCDDDTLIIGCADNRESDLYCNIIAKTFNIPFVSIGLWERAFVGEIYYQIDNSQPCYECFYKSNPFTNEKVNSYNSFYSNESELAKINFEPGISSDISFVTLIGIKIIIDILNRNNNNYKMKVLNKLSQYTLICNNLLGSQSEIFSYPLQVTTSIEPTFFDKCFKEFKCCYI